MTDRTASKKTVIVAALLLTFIFYSIFIFSYHARSKVSVLLKTDRQDLFQLYYDRTGRGFEESKIKVITTGVMPSQDFQEVTFSLSGSFFLGIKSIRLDLGTKAGPLALKEIRLTGPSGEYRRSAKEILKNFKPNGHIADLALKDNVLSLRSIGNDPFFESEPGIKEVYDSVTLHKSLWCFYHLLISLLLSLGLAAFLSSSRIAKQVFAILVLFGLFVLLGQAAKRAVPFWMMRSNHFPFLRPSLRTAVSYAAYDGYLKSLEQAVFESAFFLYLVAACAVTLLLVKKSPASEVEDVVAPRRISHLWRWGGLILIVLYYFFAVFPDIKSMAGPIRPMIDFTAWDKINHLVWEYCFVKGWLPYKDFWYPYSPIMFEQSIPLHFPFLVVPFSCFVFSTYHLTRKSLFWTAFTAIAVWTLIPAWVVSQRYYPSAVSVLFLLALQRMEKPKWAYYLFALLLSFFFMIEPMQMLYVGACSLILILVYYRKAATKERRVELLLNLLRTVILGSILTACYLVFLYIRGQLAGFVNFYWNDIARIAAYAAYPTGLKFWYRIDTPFENLVFLSMHLFLAYGIFQTIREMRTPVSASHGDIILAIGLLGYVLFQKQLLRPHIAFQIIGIYYIGLIIFLIQLVLQLDEFRRRTMTCVLSMLLALVCYDAGIQEDLSSMAKTPAIVVHNIGSLLGLDDMLEKVYQASFDPTRFDESSREIIQYLTKHAGHPEDAKIFAFPDNGHLYILANQKPPQYITAYDSSPLGAQQKILKWLEETKPTLVFWDFSSGSFDGVPHLVRIPLIYDYIIRNYVPFDSISKYEVLVPRKSNSPIDIKYWKEKLGDTVDLGAIPANSSIRDFNYAEQQSGKSNAEFLHISIPSQIPNEKRSITFLADGQIFHVVFKEIGGIDDYYINLSRLWFWNAIRSEQPKAQIGIVGDSEFAGLEIIRTNCDSLY